MSGSRRIRAEPGDHRVERRGHRRERHARRRAPADAVGRRRDDDVVRAARCAETAVGPRRDERPRTVDGERRERDRTHGRVVGRGQLGEGRARERRAAVDRAKALDRARERLLSHVVAGDRDERPVRQDRRLRADEHAGRGHRRRPGHAAVVARLAHGGVLLVIRVQVVAAAAERARCAVVARDPVLVERRARSRGDRRRPVQAVARARDHHARSALLDRQRGDEPHGVRGVVRDARVGGRALRSGRCRLGGDGGEETPCPRAAGVVRDGEPDVRRAAGREAADLVRGDDGRSPGSVRRLDSGLVLARRVRRRVDGEPARDDLAVCRDGVAEVGGDDVEPAAAVDRVLAAPRGLHEVVAGAAVDVVGRGRAEDDSAELGRMDGRGGGRRGEHERKRDQQPSHRAVSVTAAPLVDCAPWRRTRRTTCSASSRS